MNTRVVAVILGLVMLVGWFFPLVNFIGFAGQMYQTGEHIGGVSYLILVAGTAYAILIWIKQYQPAAIAAGLGIAAALIICFNIFQANAHVGYGMGIILTAGAFALIYAMSGEQGTFKPTSKPARYVNYSLWLVYIGIFAMGLFAGNQGNEASAAVDQGSKAYTARLQLEEFSAALDLYKLEVGGYPSTQEGLQALFQSPAGVTGWNGPYIKNASHLKDPWGNNYRYASPGSQGAYDVYTFGADNKEGGSGENADLASS